MFKHLEAAPADAILGLNEAFGKDQTPGKINLTTGVYKDADGQTSVLDCVKEEGEAPRPLLMFNPEIVASSDDLSTYEEGCLSIPGYRGTVKRAERVRARALDLNGKVTRIKAEGLLAQALEHETDHLNGFLYIDRLVSRDTLWKVTYNPEGEPEYRRVNSAEAPDPDEATAGTSEPPDHP